jgi:hypothetical protein
MLSPPPGRGRLDQTCQLRVATGDRLGFERIHAILADVRIGAVFEQ